MCDLCVNPLQLMFNKINAYLEETNGNKYLMLVPTNESKDKIKKYEELWTNIRDLIKSVIIESDEYDEKQMRIKFDTDDKLPPNKTIKIPIITTVVRAVFHENNKYYPKEFQMNVCMKYRWKIMN